MEKKCRKGHSKSNLIKVTVNLVIVVMTAAVVIIMVIKQIKHYEYYTDKTNKNISISSNGIKWHYYYAK